MDWTLCFVHPPLLLILLLILEHIFLQWRLKHLPKEPTPRLSATVIGRRWPQVPQWASATLLVQLFLLSTYWEWHQIASCSPASYWCYQTFRLVSNRVIEIRKHTISTLWIFFLTSNVHILFPAKFAELLKTLVGTARHNLWFKDTCLSKSLLWLLSDAEAVIYDMTIIS